LIELKYMKNNKGIASTLIVLIVVGVLALGGGTYFLLKKNSQKPISCTTEAKLCSDGSYVSRTGPKCEFAPCPTASGCRNLYWFDSEHSTCQEPKQFCGAYMYQGLSTFETKEACENALATKNWKTYTNKEYGFEFKYPNGFFDSNQEPKVLVGDCNYGVFPNECPNINNIVIEDLASSGGDIKAIKNNLSSPNYWKNPNGEKSTINNVTYCLYQTEDAAMGHTYNYYYYATITNKKCLVVNLRTSTTNCDFYLPIEKGNTEQQKNYNDCLVTNQNQPKTLNEILSTFQFTNQHQTGCNTNSDCQNGASCMVEGPIIANQPIHKVCVPKGQVVPL